VTPPTTKYLIVMQFTLGDGTPEKGISRDIVTGKDAVKVQCEKNREWLRAEGHREENCRVIEIGSLAHKEYLRCSGANEF